MDSNLKPLVTAETAAIYLWGEWNDSTRKRIYKWIKEGKIETIKDGRRYWIPRAALTQFDNPGVPDAGSDQPADIGSAVFQIGNG